MHDRRTLDQLSAIPRPTGPRAQAAAPAWIAPLPRIGGAPPEAPPDFEDRARATVARELHGAAP